MSVADYINLAIAAGTILSVVVSLAVAVVSYKSVQASRAAVDVMRAQLEAVTRPYILVVPVVRPMTTFFELHITNTGGSSAKNLRLALDKDYFFNAGEGENLRTFAAFTHPISEFPPRAELRFSLGLGHKILRSDRSPLRFGVLVTYEYDGREISEKNVVDLQPFWNAGQPVDPVAERLDKIRSELESIASALRKGDG